MTKQQTLLSLYTPFQLGELAVVRDAIAIDPTCFDRKVPLVQEEKVQEDE